MSIDEQPMNVYWSGQKSPTSNKYKINYKGTVTTASDLPATGNKKGDTYNISEDGSDYIWTGTEWNKFGANVYIGATSTANGIQGLVPSASSSQIYSLLIGGGTWKSAEDLGLALDDEVVHLTGDEIIQGEKVFKNEKVYSTSGNHISNISIRNPALKRGTATNLANNKSVYSSLLFLDNEGSEEYPYDGRLALIGYIAPRTGDLQEQINLCCYNYFSENKLDNAALAVGYSIDRIPYATAPETSSERTNSTDIVTRGYMEASEQNWQKTNKSALVRFKPVPESDLESVVSFMFTETLPAEGEKGSENPSTIAGVESVKVTLCGKNLITLNSNLYSRTLNGITLTVNDDGTFILNGTATSSFQYYIWTSSASPVNVKSGTTYTLTGCPTGVAPSTFSIRMNRGSALYIDFGNGITFTPQESGVVNLFINISSGSTASNLVFKPQLELGSTATSFEPYSGADYSIDLGGTFYGGSIDLVTGVMTVTHQAVTLDASTVDISSAPAALPLDYADTYGRTIASADGTSLVVGSTGGTVVYKLATPQTVQLTPVQIRSLPALDKYEPRINTVYTDQEAVQIGYPKYFDENRLAALEARIEALEANQG